MRKLNSFDSDRLDHERHIPNFILSYNGIATKEVGEQLLPFLILAVPTIYVSHKLLQYPEIIPITGLIYILQKVKRILFLSIYRKNQSILNIQQVVILVH